MLPVEIIKNKREGHSLKPRDIKDFVADFVKGRVEDYQMSAFLMAVYFNGMDRQELLALTEAFVDSGQKLDFGKLDKPTVDKHSTGGVGDKVSLIVCPMVAAAGASIPKISGRGLGHTGGTIDKLDSIPGFKAILSPKRCLKILEDVGVFIASQSRSIVPADNKIYSIRNDTATVDSIPLIVASIISKKLAVGAKSLVLDIKFGNGAFMKTARKSRRLARSLVEVGNHYGLNTAAILTDMNQPLGYAVGNALEVKEAIEYLRGDKRAKDLNIIVISLGAIMLQLSGVADSLIEGKRMLKETLNSGTAIETLRKMIAAQEGDIRVIYDLSVLPQAPVVKKLLASTDGWIYGFDTCRIGMLSVELGAGRIKKDDKIDPSVGLVFTVKRGDKISKREVLAEVHAKTEHEADIALKKLSQMITISTSIVRERKPILTAITAQGERRFMWNMEIL